MDQDQDQYIVSDDEEQSEADVPLGAEVLATNSESDEFNTQVDMKSVLSCKN
jgi:hypothetical protein